MNKKRSTREVIENTSNPGMEHGFIKFPGQEAEDVTRDASETSVSYDLNKLKELFSKNRQTKYTVIHTHPTSLPKLGFFGNIFSYLGGTRKQRERVGEINAIPSGDDLRNFLETDQKTMVIAVRDSESGQVLGYNVTRKLKETPKFDELKFGQRKMQMRKPWYIMNGLEQDTISFETHRVANINSGKYEKISQEFNRLAQKYHLQCRFVPSEGYEISKNKGKFVKKTGLEGSVSAICLISSLFFLSPNLTGNAIADLSVKTSSFLGIGVFIVALISGMLWLKTKRE